MQAMLPFMQQHWQLSSALVILFVLLLIIELLRQKSGTTCLSALQATQMINHQHAVVVDIRSNDAFKTGHIINAISVPLNELDANPKKLEKYKTKPIILVCATGTESPRAAGLLSKHGFQSFRLSHGMRSWRDADMPIVKG